MTPRPVCCVTACWSRPRRRSAFPAGGTIPAFRSTRCNIASRKRAFIAEIDCVAFYENPLKKLERQVWSHLPQLRQGGLGELNRFDTVRPLREISERFGYTGRVMCFDHHLSHAASAYSSAVSPMPRCSRSTAWANGRPPPTARGEGRNSRCFRRSSFPLVGLLYCTLTSYLGFERQRRRVQGHGARALRQAAVHRPRCAGLDG